MVEEKCGYLATWPMYQFTGLDDEELRYEPPFDRPPLSELVEKLGEETSKTDIIIGECPSFEISEIKKDGNLVKNVVSYRTQLGGATVDLHNAVQQLVNGEIQEKLNKLDKKARRENGDENHFPKDRLSECANDSYDVNNLPDKELAEKAREILSKAEIILLKMHRALVHDGTFTDPSE